MNRKFFSIRWKLVSTYLILAFISVILINIITYRAFLEYKIEEKHLSISEKIEFYQDRIEENLLDSAKITGIKNVNMILNNLSLSTKSTFLLIDKNDNIILETISDGFDTDLIERQTLKKNNRGYKTHFTFSADSRESILCLIVPINVLGEPEYSIVSYSEINGIKEYIKNIFSKMVVPFVIVFIILYFVSLFLSNTLIKPLEKIIDAIKNIIMSGQYKTIDVKSTDEFYILSEQFNILMTKFEQVNDLRDKFVSNVNHELRTPIASMLIISDTLENTPSDDIEIYKDFMSDINFEMNRLSKIIDTLLKLVKQEKGELTLEYSSTNLNNLVVKSINLIKPLANKKNITIDFLSKEILILSIDSEKITQAFLNILNNAIKYTREDGSIVVKVYTTRDSINISIKDTGMGIPAEDHENIFDRFYRVDEARARDTGGTGLGLSIAKQIMSLHMGSIALNSKVGVGSEFILIFPKNTFKN